jgi:hypothetical protein
LNTIRAAGSDAPSMRKVQECTFGSVPNSSRRREWLVHGEASCSTDTSMERATLAFAVNSTL